MPSMPLEEVNFAVVDLETTGLFPKGNDRIVEIAIVWATVRGEILDEYSTLVNPQRDVGPTQIHGLRASDIVLAPSFEAIAGDVVDRISGRPLAGHNVRFDFAFLSIELSRLGVNIPPLPCVCTLTLVSSFDLPSASRRLSSCCEALGIPHADAHSALGDARATAHLLCALFRQGPYDSLPDLGCQGQVLPAGSFPHLRRSGLICTRETAADRKHEQQSYLSRLASRMPLVPAAPLGSARRSDGLVAYLDLLDRALADRHISPNEAEALMQLAAEWGMSRDAIHEAHLAYLRGLAAAALADGVVSKAEREDLSTVAKWLGLREEALADALNRASAGEPEVATRSVGRSNLVGSSVCFTGEMTCSINGDLVTREMAEELAAKAGLVVLRSVTKKLDVLVAADALSLSTKARKAREYGVEIIAEAAFWQMIGANVD